MPPRKDREPKPDPLATLTDPSPDIRTQAAKSIHQKITEGIYVPPEIITSFINTALVDDDWRIISYATKTLVLVTEDPHLISPPTETLLPRLKEILASPPPSISSHQNSYNTAQANALTALVNFAPEDGFTHEQVLQAINKHQLSRQAALKALGTLNIPTAESILMERFASRQEEPATDQIIINALTKRRSQTAIPELIYRLDKKYISNREDMIQALGFILEVPPQAPSTDYDQQKQAAANILLQEVLSTHSNDYALLALDSLAQIAEINTLNPLIDVLKQFNQYSNHFLTEGITVIRLVNTVLSIMQVHNQDISSLAPTLGPLLEYAPKASDNTPASPNSTDKIFATINTLIDQLGHTQNPTALPLLITTLESSTYDTYNHLIAAIVAIGSSTSPENREEIEQLLNTHPSRTPPLLTALHLIQDQWKDQN